jgi:hypothetical protein
VTAVAIKDQEPILPLRSYSCIAIKYLLELGNTKGIVRPAI